MRAEKISSYHAERFASIFDEQKKRVWYSLSEQFNFNHQGDAVVSKFDRNGWVQEIATRNWYVSTGCYVKCFDNFTYVVVGVEGHLNGIYFLTLEKVS